ncbi:unnamed protein product [Didymodactylos carnosus]|uniref:Uncharacterized protein n=1 Tax=Didymodactylos carnosus TaxID=1234261 RepID=A0A814NC98_9BILA|nr:unnamed protein product [Didymodactylos carnosus]CAF1210227.1 unnamed protein product [Didymodactylos carnosus]CAF3857057.1 unnamed protein product [Didymodactylos carnosus]CAF4019199.1 unnamed protein product [Didymodactylos carnosus]
MYIIYCANLPWDDIINDRSMYTVGDIVQVKFGNRHYKGEIKAIEELNISIKGNNAYQALANVFGYQDQILTFVQDIFSAVELLQKKLKILTATVEEGGKQHYGLPHLQALLLFKS